jgi:hypothetical protein
VNTFIRPPNPAVLNLFIITAESQWFAATAMYKHKHDARFTRDERMIARLLYNIHTFNKVHEGRYAIPCQTCTRALLARLWPPNGDQADALTCPHIKPITVKVQCQCWLVPNHTSLANFHIAKRIVVSGADPAENQSIWTHPTTHTCSTFLHAN